MSVLALAVGSAALALVVMERGELAPAPIVEPARGLERAGQAEHGRAPALPEGAPTADVVARCLPSVVNISTTRVAAEPGSSGNPFFDLLRPFLGGGGPQESQSLGSGVIVDSEGVILTNHHVVADAREIRVTLSDGREYPARSVGSDPQSDVAVLRLEIPRGESVELTAIPYGDSTALRQGDSVLAIGNPFGVGQTVTMGIVSAIGRASMGITDYEDFVQTDAAINPGNSGGALVSLRGELVGINTAILSRTGGSHGVGFAIPSNMARPLAEALLREGHVTRGWLGVALQDLNPQLARSMGIDSAGRGVVVMDIEPAGPAASADLRRADVITGLDAEAIHSSRQLRNLVATRGAGTAIQITRERAGSSGEVTITLAPRPSAPTADPSIPASGEAVAGLSLAPVTDALRQRYPLPPHANGVVVVATQQGAPGTRAGVQVGDLIVDVGGQPVSSVESFRQLYGSAFFVAMVGVQRGDERRIFIVGR